MELSTFYEKCQTGDILLFSSNRWYSKLIELFTHSPYSHVGIILRDPTFLDPSLKGLFLFESGYEPMKSPEDGKVKYGVQISKLEDVIARCRAEKSGNLYYRAVHCDRDAAFEANLSVQHTQKPTINPMILTCVTGSRLNSMCTLATNNALPIFGAPLLLRLHFTS